MSMNTVLEAFVFYADVATLPLVAPGRHGTLLCRTPLRTVHEGFPSHRSSLSKVDRSTQLFCPLNRLWPCP